MTSQRSEDMRLATPGTPGTLLRVEHLVKEFPRSHGGLFVRTTETVHALNDVTLDVRRGETLGLVGETGCGKSTLARCILRLTNPDGGRMSFDGNDITNIDGAALRAFRRRAQMVFQDPFGSLNPRHTAGFIIGEPFAIHRVAEGEDRRRRVLELLQMVGLHPSDYDRYPSEFSGGQRQRIGIARAIALRPELVICDEPVSALDVSIRAQILNLLRDLQSQLGLTYLFISHDLGVVRHLCTRVAVMYLGRIVELAPTDELFERPRHPYTRALIETIPHADPEAADIRRHVALAGDPPSPISPPSGCHFHPRCPKVRPECLSAPPLPLLASGASDQGEHVTACYAPLADGENPFAPLRSAS